MSCCLNSLHILPNPVEMGGTFKSLFSLWKFWTMDHWTAMFVVPRLYFPLSFLTAVTFIGVLNSFTWGKKKKRKRNQTEQVFKPCCKSSFIQAVVLNCGLPANLATKKSKRWSQGVREDTLLSITLCWVKLLQMKHRCSWTNWCKNQGILFQLHFETPDLFLLQVSA